MYEVGGEQRDFVLRAVREGKGESPWLSYAPSVADVICGKKFLAP